MFSKLVFATLIAGVTLSGMGSGVYAETTDVRCSGPLGTGPCPDVAKFMIKQNLPFELPQVLPIDGGLVRYNYEICRGEHRCMAVAWVKDQATRYDYVRKQLSADVRRIFGL